MTLQRTFCPKQRKIRPYPLHRCLKKNKATLASQLAEDLNISSMAGIDTPRWPLNACKIREMEGAASIIDALEPLLKYQAIQTHGCSLLVGAFFSTIRDIENLCSRLTWSRQGCLTAPSSCALECLQWSPCCPAHNRRARCLRNLGALMQRRPVTAITISSLVIERPTHVDAQSSRNPHPFERGKVMVLYPSVCHRAFGGFGFR